MSSTSTTIAWLDEVEHRAHDLLGGKCASLAEMIQAGFGVPDAFSVTTAAFWDFMRRSGLLERAREARAGLDVRDVAQVEAVSSEMVAAFLEADMPPALEQEIRAAYARLAERGGDDRLPVAVRSSGVAEDLEGASFAGQYDTFLWIVGGDAVVEHVKRCWSGLFGPAVLTYRPGGEGDVGADGQGIAVGVQRMVPAATAGVMLTLDPVTGDRSKVVVEASWGLGEAVVGGEVTPDRYRIDKVTREVIDRDVGAKEREYRFVPGGGVELHDVDPQRREMACLGDEDLRALVELARTVERRRGCPMDLEWAIDDAGTVHLLQARPETVWSRREAEPVAEAPSAMDLVLRQLVGGGA